MAQLLERIGEPIGFSPDRIPDRLIRQTANFQPLLQVFSVGTLCLHKLETAFSFPTVGRHPRALLYLPGAPK